MVDALICIMPQVENGRHERVRSSGGIREVAIVYTNLPRGKVYRLLEGFHEAVLSPELHDARLALEAECRSPTMAWPFASAITLTDPCSDVASPRQCLGSSGGYLLSSGEQRQSAGSSVWSSTGRSLAPQVALDGGNCFFFSATRAL